MSSSSKRVRLPTGLAVAAIAILLAYWQGMGLPSTENLLLKTSWTSLIVVIYWMFTPLVFLAPAFRTKGLMAESLARSGIPIDVYQSIALRTTRMTTLITLPVLWILAFLAIASGSENFMYWAPLIGMVFFATLVIFTAIDDYRKLERIRRTEQTHRYVDPSQLEKPREHLNPVHRNVMAISLIVIVVFLCVLLAYAMVQIFCDYCLPPLPA